MRQLLKDRAVIVTGAGRGLGREYALDCARRGAALVVNDIAEADARRTADEVAALGARVVVDTGSVSSWDDAESMVRRCVEEFGGVDGLVNNAATWHTAKPWDERPEELRRIVEVNVIGSLFCGVHALKRMREQGHGSIVNVTSGAHLGMRDYTAYGATKGAVASMTYGWALEAVGSGVRINAISPVARTSMSQAWFAAHDTESDAEPGIVAPLVAYLLSDDSVGVSGRVIRLDRGALSVLSPPQISERPVRRSRWTVELIDEFVSEALSSS